MSDAQAVEATGVAPEDNPVLQGNFAPVKEEMTVLELPVEGSIPPELEGALLRDGPNPIAPGRNHHWFTGDAMVHGISLAGGRATAYRNRWVRTARVQELLGLDAAPVSPNQPTRQGSGSVNVIGHGGRILALPEVGLPWALRDDLSTIGQHDFAGALKSNMTAHPKIDAATGELIFFGYDFGPVKLRYHTADRDGRLTRTVEIDKPHTTMMHDFSVTASRVVFMDFPVVSDPEMARSGKGLPFRWRDDVPARLGILPRQADSDETRWIEIDPCFVYHPLNAYDDDTRIVMDVVRHERTFVDGKLEGAGRSLRLDRWTIDPEAGRVATQTIDDRPQEFPRVDPRVECHRHRYGYAVGFAFGDGPGDLLKHDLQRGETLVHGVGPGGAASEGVFVPAGDGEDEGWLLSVVYDGNTDTSHLRIIDAQDFAGPPMARVQLPVRVPFGFHGNWIPAG